MTDTYKNQIRKENYLENKFINLEFIKGGNMVLKGKRSTRGNTFYSFCRSIYSLSVCICFLVVGSLVFPPESNAFLERPEVIIETSCGEENVGAKKILVAYDTKYGSTATVAEKIGNTLCEEGLQVDIRLARKVKKTEIADYDGVIVGSAIIYEMWLPGATNLLRRSRSILAEKTVAYFLVCGSLREETEERIERVNEYYVQPILDKFPEIEPVVEFGTFAGTVDYNKMYPIDSFLMRLIEFPDGDWRSFEKIGAWAKEVAAMME